MTCLWPLPSDTEHLPAAWNTTPEPTKLRARTLASRALEMLTGYRVGNCPVTIRPDLRVLSENQTFPGAVGLYGFYPENFAGSWSNSATCGGRPVCEVPLPAPVGRVDEVKVNGTVLDPTDYRIDNGHLLTWQGSGDCPWPRNQNMNVPDTAPGTMSVTFVNAHLPDELGAYAALALTWQFAQAMVGGKCQLPSGVQTVVRQGVTMSLALGSFPDGLTGVREVDAYVALWNPNHIVPSQVWSPDLPQHRRVGG